MSDEATIYRDEPLQTYVDDAASGKPAPGGGSVSACAGALGAALVSMVCNLTIGKEKFAAVEAPSSSDLVARSEACRAELERLLQDDTTAYNGVIEGYRMPKDTPEQQAARAAHIQAALKVAANVPLEIARVALDVCRLAKTAAELGNPAAVTDAAIGAILGEAAAQGAALNVLINLGSIKDEAYVAACRAELDGHPRRGRQAARRGHGHHARQAVKQRRGGPSPRRSSERRTETDMTAQIIDGKAIAEQVRAEIVAEVEKLAARGVKPGVATILVGDDGGAQFYRGQIEKNTGTVGFAYFNHTLPAGTSQAEVARADRPAQRRPRGARHPGAHADGRRDRPERRVQRHRPAQGPRLREPGQHRSRAARRLSVRAGHAVGLHGDPRPRGRRADVRRGEGRTGAST